MKHLKYLLIIAVLALGANLALAASWTAPTQTPPNGNTEPPINVGPIEQDKVGTIGAYKFCLYNSADRTFTNCLGGGGVSSITWPWTQVGNNLENSNGVTGNNGNIYIRDLTIAYESLFSDDPQKLTVEGLIKAAGFCLGSSCAKIGVDPGYIRDDDDVNNWQELITKYGNGVIAGAQQKNYLTKWVDDASKMIQKSSFYDDGLGKLCIDEANGMKTCFGSGAESGSAETWDTMLNRGTNTGKTIGVGGINVAGTAAAPGKIEFTGVSGIITNLRNPVATLDAATKGYVDTRIASAAGGGGGGNPCTTAGCYIWGTPSFSSYYTNLWWCEKTVCQSAFDFHTPNVNSGYRFTSVIWK